MSIDIDLLSIKIIQFLNFFLVLKCYYIYKKFEIKDIFFHYFRFKKNICNNIF